MDSSSLGPPSNKAALSPFELSFLEFCSQKRSFGQKISLSDRSFFYKCEICPGKKLSSEDELEEHIDTLHTERICTECGDCFSTKVAFDSHEHPIHTPKPASTSSSLRETLSSLYFQCQECSQSFPTQFHLSTHSRDIHSCVPQISLPPKKRSWSPPLFPKQTNNKTPFKPPDTATQKKESTSPPPIGEEMKPAEEVDGNSVPSRRVRARKNYTDIDLYLDESEEEAILQKILRQTSRLKRGRKPHTGSAAGEKRSIMIGELVCKAPFPTTRGVGGKRRGRCKKIP